MADSSYPILAREGWRHSVLAVAMATAVHYFAGLVWAVPFWIVAVFIIQFFRDPPRSIPDAPNAVICPADGKVIALGEM
jgi:phosphatidylserine decarboxylase